MPGSHRRTPAGTSACGKAYRGPRYAGEALLARRIENLERIKRFQSFRLETRHEVMAAKAIRPVADALRFAPVRSFGFRMPSRERAVQSIGGGRASVRHGPPRVDRAGRRPGTGTVDPTGNGPIWAYDNVKRVVTAVPDKAGNNTWDVTLATEGTYQAFADPHHRQALEGPRPDRGVHRVRGAGPCR
jgi:hypothetical protein